MRRFFLAVSLLLLVLEVNGLGKKREVVVVAMGMYGGGGGD